MTQLSAEEYMQICALAQRLKSLPRHELLRDPWAKTLLAGNGAKRFLSPKHVAMGDIGPIGFVTMAADCVLSAGALPPPAPATSRKAADQIRKAAVKLHDLTSVAVDLPAPTATAGFQDGLKELCEWQPSRQSRAHSQRGEPERRAFIAHVAERFYASFRTIHTEAAGEIVMLLWPNTDPRTIREELSTERKAGIISAYERKARVIGKVDTVSQLAFARMTTKLPPPKLAPVEEQIVAAIRDLELSSGNTALRQALLQVIVEHTSAVIPHDSIES